MEIKRDNLVEILSGTGATQISVVTRKSADLKKRNNPLYGCVEKIVSATYDFGGDYENRVNEALDASGINAEFKSGKLLWGVWKVVGRVIEHNGKLYVRGYRTDDVKVEYIVNGVSATPEEIATIKEFSKGGSSVVGTQSAMGLNESEQVKPVAIDFDTIVTIEIDGTSYSIAE